MTTEAESRVELAVSEEDRRLLSETWGAPPGIAGWLMQVNHKAIGKRYIITAFVFFLLAGLQALVIRMQLFSPESQLVSPQLYNTLFTVHGTTMMFLFAIPVMEGMAIYFVPLMIGTRDMAFPRLNAFGYFVFLIGGVALFIAFFLGVGPDTGWFNYPPLAEVEFSPSKRVDVWVALITFIEVAALTAAIELIVTILKQRAPGMSLDRMPLFVWAALVMSFMIVFAMPAVIVSSLLLGLDRLVGTSFFSPDGGGDPLLWQHLFWFFGHPEVYIIFVPALGMVSTVIIAFTRRRIFGYIPLVLSLIATGFISFGLWVHHMFTTGLPFMSEAFFTAASMMVAIPTGVQIFAWLASLWGSRPRFDTPMLFVIGFIILLVAGGLTGVMVAAVPFDLQVHDTFFVVAHFHYVLIGGAVFPLFGALHYWMPKLTGRKLNETAGKWSFWLFFIGFNVTFFPMHQLGFIGMPRRIYTYLEGLGWTSLNRVATVGAFIIAAGVAVFVLNVLLSRKRAGEDPWNSYSLEWAIPSPPPPYNFAAIPIVSDRYTLWTADPLQLVGGLRHDRREILVTSVLEAQPQKRLELPGPTIWPLMLSLSASIAFIGAIFTPWSVVVSLVLSFLALLGWFWPREREGKVARAV